MSELKSIFSHSKEWILYYTRPLFNIPSTNSNKRIQTQNILTKNLML